MKITEKKIQNIVERISKQNQEQAEELMERFSKEQPFVLGYAFMMEEQFENESDLELLVFLLCATWQAFEEQFGELPLVDEEMLANTAESYFSEMQDKSAFVGKTDEQIAEMQAERLKNHPQADLMEFVSAFVYAHKMSENDLRAQGAIITVAHVAINAFQKAVSK
ncbi:MAG: hypothetical protein MI784_16290 [Cytophagales bacterium]|nr:hypothetical protein [Cytophagales bacterium]